MGYQSNRLKFGLLMSLGASRELRRMWCWGCLVLMLFCGVLFRVLMPYELGPTVAISNLAQIAMFLCVGGIGLSLTGLGFWAIACVIAFVGRRLKDDYRNDRLYD